MLKLFIYNKNDRMSQQAYKALMQGQVDFTPFEVTGTNVAKRLSNIGINTVPTLYVKDDRNVRLFVGQEIIDLVEKQVMQSEESSEEIPFHHRAKQTYAPSKSEIEQRRQEEASYVAEETSEEEESIIMSDGDEVVEEEDKLMNDKGKVNAAAAMKMFQHENDKLLPPSPN